MQKKTNKRKRKTVCAIIVAAVAALIALSLIITNCFIPVRYLSAYFTVADRNAYGEMRISFIDVGYGDCTIVEFPDGKNLLIDAGDGTYSNNLKVLKELNVRGIDTVDYLICSSVSAERCGGLTEVIKYKNVLKIYAPYCPFSYVTDEYRAFSITMREKGLEAETLEYGKGVFCDEAGYSFCVLSPSVSSLKGGEIDNFCSDPTESNINNASAVIWIEFGGTGFLLTGNSETTVLDKLSKMFEIGVDVGGRTIDVSHCSVIKIPNHGANALHFNELLALTSPQYAVLSVGNNGKGRPSAFTISDAQNTVGENIYRTDGDGTIIFTVRNGGLQADKEKK